MANFTFKTKQPTGKWKSFDSPEHVIKLNKREVGTISDKHPHKISLMVYKSDPMEDGNPNCTWKWITFKRESETIDDAKKWLMDHANEIQQRYKLYELDD